MPFQLRLEEMISVLQELKCEHAGEYLLALEEIGTKAINEICSLLDIVPGEATYNLGFIAAPVYSRTSHQSLPDVLAPYDNVDEWSQAPSGGLSPT